MKTRISILGELNHTEPSVRRIYEEVPKPTMEYIFVFLAALGVLACHGQSTDGCQVKGYNLEPLSK